MNKGIKDVWGFKVGAAVSQRVLQQPKADDVLKQHFSSLTAENCMKPALIQPQENVWTWDEADFIANYARQNGFVMRGHTTLWHNQSPAWFFEDGDKPASKTLLFKRLEAHMAKITERYNDIIYAWDVLNEVIEPEKGDALGFRPSKWYDTCGQEVFEFAFKCMKELSPNSRLIYNDYNNEQGEKLDITLRFLSDMLDKGIPVHGVGLQGHWKYDFKTEEILRNAIEKYIALGLEIELTEVDISIYRDDESEENPVFFSERPEDRIKEQALRYKEIFSICAEYPSVKNITMWGIADNYTWLNNFPVRNRKNWPLLFNENYEPKESVELLLG